MAPTARPGQPNGPRSRICSWLSASCSPDLAVGRADGGRLQIRNRTASPGTAVPSPTEDAAAETPTGSATEAWEEEKVPAGHWREVEGELLLTLHRAVSA